MNRKRLFSNILSIILFGLLLISAFLQQAFHFLPETENSENRRLSDKPAMRIQKLDPFPQAYEAYYNDHFAFRNQLVKFYAELNLDVFEKCPYPDQVILGKKGQLFLVPKELDNYRRIHLFSAEELSKIESEFLYRKQYLESKGIDYYLAVCPTKYSIYPELLPWYVRKKDTLSRTDQVIGLMRKIGIQVIDLRETLIAAKDSVQEMLFMATDNHWNEIGAFYAYQAIMTEVTPKHPGLTAYQYSDYNVQPFMRDGGNLAVILNKANEIRDRKYYFNPKYKIRTTMIDGSPFPVPAEFDPKEYFKGYFIRDSKLPKMLMVHDSFGKYVQPFFKDSFSRSIFIWDKWQYKLNEPILEAEKPDVYITLCLESLLQGMADNCEMRTLSATAYPHK